MILPINQASDDQLDELAIIGSNPVIYKQIGYGQPWNHKYVRQLREYALMDAAQGKQDYLHWLILNNNKVVGYIGIHPAPSEFPGMQLRSFVDPLEQGKGIGTKATLLVLSELRGRGNIWAFISPTNKASMRVKEKAGFIPRGQTYIGETLMNIYVKMI